MTTTETLASILEAYTLLSGREAKLPIYEHSLFDWVRAGFTKEDMIIVVQFIVRENRHNTFKYSLKLGHLINDHQRFNDLLEEAKAKERNRRPAMTPKEKVLSQLRPVMGETMTVTEIPTAGEILKRVLKI
jgi:hypothetical protein